jgi:DNA-binding response OmpR family regulator
MACLKAGAASPLETGMTKTDCLPQALPSTASRRVLLVEDNADSRASLQMILQFWGHQVQVAEDGRRGLDLALSWQPEIAVLDIGLPFLDGYQVAREIRTSLGERMWLIALTGFGQPENRRTALGAGFNAFMTKPADLDELAQLLAGGFETQA